MEKMAGKNDGTKNSWLPIIFPPSFFFRIASAKRIVQVKSLALQKTWSGSTDRPPPQMEGPPPQGMSVGFCTGGEGGPTTPRKAPEKNLRGVKKFIKIAFSDDFSHQIDKKTDHKTSVCRQSAGEEKHLGSMAFPGPPPSALRGEGWGGLDPPQADVFFPGEAHTVLYGARWDVAS